MLDLKQWDIWEAIVPFQEDSSKTSVRPVLIIEPTKVLVLKMTTHQHSDDPKPLEFEISKWNAAGLTAKTFIQCDRFIELHMDSFTGKQYGRLQAVDIVGVQSMMKFHGLIR